MNNIKRIQRVSAKFRLLFTVLSYAIPAFTLLYWLFFNSLHISFTEDLPVEALTTFPLTTLVLAFFVSLIPACVVVYGVIKLKDLFKLYEEGIVFSEQNVRCFYCLGCALICWVGAKIIFTALISIVLSFNNPVGEKMVVVELNISDLSLLIIGAVVILISWVMQEAVKLEDEQAYLV